MKIILDTNVLISGIFFGGIPGEILGLWKQGKIELILSIEIFEEYKRISDDFTKRHPGLALERIFEIIGEKSRFYIPKNDFIKECRDPNDHMFINCAIVSKTKFIITGDKGLLDISGFKSIEILKPKEFLDKYFK